MKENLFKKIIYISSKTEIEEHKEEDKKQVDNPVDHKIEVKK